MDLDSIPFVRAKYYTSTNGRKIDLIVVHTMEAPEKDGTAEAVANYFARGERRVSAHYCIDNNSIVRCVLDKDVAYAAPGANNNGIQLEHAGYASQGSSQWSDDYSDSMLKLSAELVAELVKKYGIPVEKLGPEDLKRGKRGITGHVDVNNTFHQSTHTDPGSSFPWERYLSYIKKDNIDKESVRVFVSGVEITDSYGYIEDGISYAWVRSLAEPLNFTIVGVQTGMIKLEYNGKTFLLSAVIEDGKAFVPLKEIGDMIDSNPVWDPRPCVGFFVKP